VIKFVGPGNEPQPLRDDEINKILGLEPVEAVAEPKEQIPFRAGQVVEVTEGPFSDFTGTVQDVYHDKGKVKVEVSLFGRPTSVELDYTQLKGY
jgi:transcriptional antiterminator NusG